MSSWTYVVVVLAFGILIGALIANANFRRTFFVNFRKFLGSINMGQGSRGRRESPPRGSARPREGDEIRHRYTEDHHLVKCPRCGGSGRVAKKTPKLLDPKLFGGQTERCPDCKGTGKVYD